MVRAGERRRLFVTGAASGIGRATAERFVGRGWFVGVLNGIYRGLPLLKSTPDSSCFTTASSAAIYGMPRAARSTPPRSSP